MMAVSIKTLNDIANSCVDLFAHLKFEANDE